jgi:hypothetical protein
MLGCVAYGALVFLGMAGLGFLLAPAVGHASGLFPVEVEARAFFSLVTLRAVPYLVALAVVSGFAYEGIGRLGASRRITAYASNTLLGYGLGATLGTLLQLE